MVARYTDAGVFGSENVLSVEEENLLGGCGNKLSAAVMKRLGRLMFRSILFVRWREGGLVSVTASAKNGRVAVSDVPPVLIRDLRRLTGPGTEGTAGNAVSLPCKRGSFDIVVCTDVSYCVAHAAAALREMHRVLKPFGRLVLAGRALPGGPTGIVNVLLYLGSVGRRMLYSRKALTALAERSGFGVSDVSFPGMTEFVMTAVAL
jgi:SAM-dependent methyltransferase